jgi:hypothetical protein
MGEEKLLHIYLSDHLAMAIGITAVAKRCLSNNRNTSLGSYLDGHLIPELEADRAALENVMDSLGAPKSTLKHAAARLAVQAGRLKLNGRRTTYSPLSKVEELEGLCLGVDGALLLWKSLASVSRRRSHQIRGVDIDRLIERAERQRAELQRHHLDAADEALA